MISQVMNGWHPSRKMSKILPRRIAQYFQPHACEAEYSCEEEYLFNIISDAAMTYLIKVSLVFAFILS
jgi:hypothetical protein